MKLRKLAIFVLALVMALPLIASAETAYPETVKFAAIYGFTGSNATTANYNQEAIDFMVDYINDNGGIASMNGAKIEVVYGDNTSDTTVCVTVADRVFSDESVMFALGAGSSTLLLPMLPSVEKYQVPILTNNTADFITEQGYRYVFRCNIKGSQEAGHKTDFLNWLIAEKGYSADIFDLCWRSIWSRAAASSRSDIAREAASFKFSARMLMPCASKYSAFFDSQPGIGGKWTSATPTTAASVEESPPGFVK